MSRTVYARGHVLDWSALAAGADEAPAGFLDPAKVLAIGRFAAAAAPWVRCGGNCLPQVPGEKKPAVQGWGAKGSHAGELAASFGAQPGPLHSEDSPKIPLSVYGAWAQQFREHNALVFPASLGCLVVDVDDPALLARVISACGDTPYRTISGRVGGGLHLWYSGTTRSRNGIVPGIDVKSTGGYVIAPGSIHPHTGHEYTASPELAAALASGHFRPPRPHPDWRVRLTHVASGITHPTRMDLYALADQLGANQRKREIAKRLRLVAQGKPPAEEGERDGVLFTLLAELAQWWPHAEGQSLRDLFAPALASWADEDWLAILDEKWVRLSGEREDELEAADARLETLRRVAWSWVGEAAAEQAALGDPIVVHKGRSYYVRVGQRWAGPWMREDFGPDVIAALRALYGIDVADFPALMAGFGQRLRDIRASFVVPETVLEAGVLTVAAGRLRQLEPAYSPVVDAGLWRMSGQWVHHLRRWIGGLTRVDVPSRALVLSGPRGTGKTLVINGLTRLWEGGAAQMRHVLGRRFNDRALETPFSIADDDTSPAEAGAALAAYLRQAVSDREQAVERKYHDVQRVEGCMRFAIGTNDPLDLVQGAVSYKLNDESIAAFADRLLHIPIDAACRGWWGDAADRLVEGDEIARHALWLAQHYTEAEDRFWVSAADTSLQQLASLSSGLRGDILLRLHEQGPGSKLIGDVYEVQARALAEQWIMDRPRGLTVRAAGLAIKALALSSGLPQPPHGGGPRKYHIPRDLVEWYAGYAGV